MGRFCKFICFQLLASEPENLPRAAHLRKVHPAFQVKAAALSSGSHRCCPTLELTGGCSTLLTQMSVLSRAEHIPVHLQDSKSSQGSLQTATGYGAAEGREGVTPPACSPGCRAPSWPLSFIVEPECDAHVSTPRGPALPTPCTHSRGRTNTFPRSCCPGGQRPSRASPPGGLEPCSMQEQLTRVCPWLVNPSPWHTVSPVLSAPSTAASREGGRNVPEPFELPGRKPALNAAFHVSRNSSDLAKSCCFHTLLGPISLGTRCPNGR